MSLVGHVEDQIVSSKEVILLATCWMLQSTRRSESSYERNPKLFGCLRCLNRSEDQGDEVIGLAKPFATVFASLSTTTTESDSVAHGNINSRISPPDYHNCENAKDYESSGSRDTAHESDELCRAATSIMGLRAHAAVLDIFHLSCVYYKEVRRAAREQGGRVRR